MDADVELARVDALDRQPVDEIGIGRAAEPAEQRPHAASVSVRQPSAKRAPSIRARPGASSQSGASSISASSRAPSLISGADLRPSALAACCGQLDELPSSSAASVSMP